MDKPPALDITAVREMRNAIDMIEGALMGADRIDWERLPTLFETTGDEVVMNLNVTVGQFRQVCTALAECTRIINSDEYVIRDRSTTDTPATRVERQAATGWLPITTAPIKRMILVWGNGNMRFAIQDEHGNWRSPMGHPKLAPKYWMCLPEPPRDGASL